MLNEKRDAFAMALNLLVQLAETKDELTRMAIIGLLLENLIKQNPNKK